MVEKTSKLNKSGDHASSGTIPESFPAPTVVLFSKRRAVFSKSVFGLGAHHVTNSSYTFSSHRDRHRRLEDYSLRLIDDLSNRPVDPLFMDSRLNKQNVSKISLWITRIIVFVICIAVGTVGSQFVRKLHADSRKAIRVSLANELTTRASRFDNLVKEVAKLRASVDKESKRINTPYENQVDKSDNMTNGTHAVYGPGVVLTIANPISASNDVSNGSLPREMSKGARIKVVTDRDIQIFVSILWDAGAEAISINGYRIGSQTSIRTAGSTILVGVNQTQSPYTIEAIGDSSSLIEKLNSQKHSEWFTSLTNAGINPQVSATNNLKLSAAGTGEVNFAKELTSRR